MAMTTLLPSSSRRDVIVIATIVCLLTVIISFRSIVSEHVPWRTQSPSMPTFGSSHNKPTTQTTKTQLPLSTSIITSTSVTPTPSSVGYAGCDGFPETEDIFVVMKTGATEAYDKLPIHFLTTLKCAKSYILFSDMEMNMAGKHLFDALDEISDKVKADNNDFELYRKLQEYYRLREDPRPLKENNNGWNLDKYKFTHMLLKTYRERPDAPWYVFMEADTALVWDNVRTFLDKYDPSKPYFFGSPTYLDIEFAHGGSGYFISQAAMQAAVGDHPEIAAHYDEGIHDICCGDWAVGRVMLDVDIHLTKTWPMINGEKPSTLPFAENHWCQPVLTMHHLTAQEVSQVWNFEQERKATGNQTPLIFMDIFNYFVSSALRPTRVDWSNLSTDMRYTPPPADYLDGKSYNGRTWSELNDIERNSPSSPDACHEACDDNEDCMQWMHKDNECALSRSIKLGGSKQPEQGKVSVSGWHLGRVEAFKAKAGDCKKVDWII